MPEDTHEPTTDEETDANPGDGSDGFGDDASPERRPLWVVIEIDVGDDCPLTDVDRPIHDVDLQQMGRVCRSQVVTGGKDDVEVLHLEQYMQKECVADVFHEYDCVPHVTDVREDSILVTVHPCDRSMIPELVGGLQDVGYPARVDRIVRIDEEVLGTPPVLCDFSLLTEKQQEALVLAVERGYYEQPREATLEDLAEDLDVGKSAVSHRLKAAEAKIIRNHMPRTNDL
ncbi:MAG: helix-turn-helix domain-containing protein [Halanaeroarchaeum sp.]